MLWSIIYLKALCSCGLCSFFSFTPFHLWLHASYVSLNLSPSLFPPLTDLHVEGLFRVPGHSLRQAALREMLNAGAELDLEAGDFHPNDAATVLKAYLGELPEPLLTHRHYHAHLKIGGGR